VRRKRSFIQKASGLFVPAPLRFGWWPCCGLWCPQRCTAAPMQYQVVLAGIANDTCSCTDLNDAYILDRETDTEPANTWCSWAYTVSPTICNVNVVRLQNYEPTVIHPNDYSTLIRVVTGGGQGIFFRKLRGASKPDCTSYQSENIPYHNCNIGCDASSATCVITAL